MRRFATCIVMLKNDGILPLDKNRVKTIGIIGPNSDSREALRANYYGTSSENVTLLEGIRGELGTGTRILYAQGSHLYKDSVQGGADANDRQKEAVSVAERSDVVVLCLGLDAGIEGEEGDANNEYAAGDKRTLSLPKTQTALLEAVVATGKPVVLCVMAGSALDLRFAHTHVNSILQAWYPGTRGGKAIADILFGKISPSGKLPVTFYNSADDLPAFSEYAMKGRTYRYLEKKPLYPFGYGLNYADIVCLSAECRLNADGSICVKAVVTNEGAREAGDVLEVYIKDMESSLAVPNYSLCGVKPFVLGVAERKTVQLTVKKSALEVVDEDGKRRKDSRRFTFYVGCSQPDARSVELTGRRPVEISMEI